MTARPGGAGGPGGGPGGPGAAAPPPGRPGGMRGPGHDGHGHAGRASRRTSAARCAGCSATCGPERPLILVVVLLAVVSVTFAVLGPKILGEAINLIFAGAVGAQLPAGATQDQVVAGLRAAGQDQLADFLASLTLTPGAGHRLRRAGASSWPSSSASTC